MVQVRYTPQFGVFASYMAIRSVNRLDTYTSMSYLCMPTSNFIIIPAWSLDEFCMC